MSATILYGNVGKVTHIVAGLPEGRFASASERRGIWIWNPDGTKHAVLDEKEEHGAPTVVLRLADGRLLTTGWDCTIRLWDTREGKEVGTHAIKATMTVMLQLADGRLVGGSRLGSVYVWELEGDGLRLVRTLTGHAGHIESLAQLSDGRLVGGDEYGKVIVWEV